MLAPPFLPLSSLLRSSLKLERLARTHDIIGQRLLVDHYYDLSWEAQDSSLHLHAQILSAARGHRSTAGANRGADP